MDQRFAFSPADLARVKSVQFGILSPDEIRQMSVVKIESCEKYVRGKPKAGGLSDPKLGTMSRHLKCETCAGSIAECPGHFGHLELAEPVFHIGFLKTILCILRCVCYNCSRLLADEDDHRFKVAKKIRNPKQRMKKVLDCCKTRKTCEEGDQIEEDILNKDDGTEKTKKHGGCGAKQPKISTDGMRIVAEFRKRPAEEQDQHMPQPVVTKEQFSAERVFRDFSSRVESKFR